MEFQEVNEEYEAKMAGFEVDCNDGKGTAAACHHVGEFYSVVKDQHDRAAAVYTNNCTTYSYPASCFNLAKLFLAGRGLAQDDVKAMELFKISCDGGHPYGCYHYGALNFIAANDEIRKRLPQASAPVLVSKPQKKSLAAKVADMAGNKNVKIGRELSYKDKSDEELREIVTSSLSLLEQTCKNGEWDSCYFVGGNLVRKNNPDRNPVRAKELFEKGCKLNHAQSCHNLAVMYRLGDTGVPKNEALFNEYKKRTEDLAKTLGSSTLSSFKTA